MPEALRALRKAGNGLGSWDSTGDGRDSGHCQVETRPKAVRTRRRFRTRPQRHVYRVGVFALVLVSLFSLRILSSVGWDPTVFIGFGVEAQTTTEYAEDRLGEVFLRLNHGHDGKTFFVQANDPLLLNPAENALILEAPAYRSHRMMYPFIAGGAGLFGPEVIIWSLLIVNLLAFGFGSWAVGDIASSLGRSPWWGLAFLFNIGFLSAFAVGAAGVLAGAFTFWGVAMIMKGKTPWAILFLVLAALTRDTALIVALGVAVWLWRTGDRRRSMVAFGLPAAALGVWAVYVQWRLEWTTEVQVGSFGFPLQGLMEALPGWTRDPIHLVAGSAMVVLLILSFRRVLRQPSLIGWAFAGYVIMAILMVEDVWAAYWDSTRVMAPLITAFVLQIIASPSPPRRSTMAIESHWPGPRAAGSIPTHGNGTKLANPRKKSSITS